MLEAILPASASAAATRLDTLETALPPVEAASVDRAVEGRRREFATGRACARAALARWGLSRRAIPMGHSGAPLWPSGIVGSITHCDGYRACAVARVEDLLAIGIDAEPNEPLRDGVLSAIATPEEAAWVQSLTREVPQVRWDRLLFSMKEAVFKAWFPLTERPLGFDRAVISVDPSAGAFTTRLLVSTMRIDGLPLAGFTGRWLARDGIVLTAIALPADRAVSEPPLCVGTAG